MPRITLIVAMFCLSSIFLACGPGPTPTPLPTADAPATETRVAANIYGTETASVPTATNTPTRTNTPTATNTPTVTRTPTASRTPTYTPTLTATATPSPTVTTSPTLQSGSGAVEGWTRFQGGGAEIWLPKTFVGGDMEKDLPLIVERLRALGPDFARMADALEKNSSSIKLWAFDTENVDPGFLTNVSVSEEKVLSFVTIDLYMEMATRQLPAQFKVVETSKIPYGTSEAGRILIDSDIKGVQVKQAFYVIRSKDAIWLVTFSTSADEFESRLPMFDRSVKTFLPASKAPND